MLVAYEFFILDTTTIPPGNYSVFHRKLFSGHAPLSCRHLDQRFACAGGSLSEIFLVEISWRGLASGSCSLVGSNSGVALNQLYSTQRYTQLFCHQLGLDGEHALAEITLACVSRNGPVRRNGNPRINFLGIDMREMRIKRTLCK